jgi:hypothetical protein
MGAPQNKNQQKKNKIEKYETEKENGGKKE